MVACPLALVIAVAVAPFGGKTAPAPLAGPVNVTVTPDTGFPFASFTTTTSGLVKFGLIAVVWPSPLMAATVAGVLFAN
jgi:hypothetical protein